MDLTREEAARAPGFCRRCGVYLTRKNREILVEGPPLCNSCYAVISDAEYQRLGGVL